MTGVEALQTLRSKELKLKRKCSGEDEYIESIHPRPDNDFMDLCGSDKYADKRTQLANESFCEPIEQSIYFAITEFFENDWKVVE